MSGPVLAIEQSGYICRAVLFSTDRRVLATAREELTPVRPRRGLAELDPAEIWSAAVAAAKSVLVQARVPAGSLAAVGVVGDPATTILWDRETGKPLHNAILAEDQRTEGHCRALREAEVDRLVRKHTGLRLTGLRAATKLAWILDNVEGARNAAEAGRAIFGSPATWLLWRLTDGRVHATDATSAAATLLFNLSRQDWDNALLDVFSVPAAVLPKVFDNATYFGAIDAEHLGGSGPVGLHGMAATQQAAMLGQAGIGAGAMSVNLAEGCSVLLATGGKQASGEVREEAGLACRLGGRPSYARLAANSAGGDGYLWASRTLGLAGGWREADRLAEESDHERELAILPAGLASGYPWLRPSGKGLIIGITANAAGSDLIRAGLESAAFATNDIIDALQRSGGDVGGLLRVSGGVARSDWAMQFLADISGRAVERAATTDAAALGVAWLAAAGAGIWPDNQTFIAELPIERRFEPRMPEARRRERVKAWRGAVKTALAVADAG